MTPVAPTPVAPASSGSRLLNGLLWIAVAVVVASLVLAVALWPETPPDTQPPSPPGALSLGETTCKSITLSWAASTDDTGVARYDISRDGQLITSVDGGTRSVTITVVPAVTWGLYVNARDQAGNASQASETMPVTPPQCGSDAKAPSTPGAVKATADGTSITVTWDAATDDVGVAVYEVFRDGGKVGSITGPGDAKQLAFTDVGVPVSSGHRYQVSARDSQGNASSRSAAVNVTAGSSCTLLCTITAVAKDTDVVWGLAELPDGSVLYGRRDAHEIVRLDPRTGQPTTLGEVPGVVGTNGEGGLMGLAIAPTFAKDGWIYVFHSTATDNRIVRLRLRGGELDTGSLQSLVVGIPRNKFHNGGRLRFGPDGKLYAATGDAQNPRAAQDQRSLAGKILRFNPDGTVPASNPFGGYIWSLGHRDPQGLAFDSRGRLWEQDFGDSAMDETNLIVKGGNYGWPACEGTESKSGDGCATPGFVAPQHTYPVTEGSCSGVAVVRNVLYIACLRGSRLYRAEIDGDKLANVQAVLVGTYGRLRTVEPGAGGTLWITSSNGDDTDGVAGNTDTKIMRITLPPAS